MKNLTKISLVTALAGAVLGGCYGLQKRDTLSEERVSYNDQEYRVYDSKSEGVVMSEYPNPIFANRIVDIDRDGWPDSYRYVAISPNRAALAIDIYPNDQQVDLFREVTKDFYAQRNAEAQN